MSQEIREEQEEVVSENMIKQAQELATAISGNAELLEKFKELDKFAETIKHIAREMNALYELRRKTIVMVDDIVETLSRTNNYSRIEIFVDSKDIMLYTPSGTRILRLKFDDAKNLTIGNLLMKIVDNDDALGQLLKRYLEILDEATRTIADKFDLIEKINTIKAWIDENDP
jgi:hypothetical protein